MATFAVGQSFSSDEELQKKVDAYQKEKCVQLTHQDSRAHEAEFKSGWKWLFGPLCLCLWWQEVHVKAEVCICVQCILLVWF